MHSSGPYIPYEVNISAVTIAGSGHALSEVFFTQETGIILQRHNKRFSFYSSQRGSKH